MTALGPKPLFGQVESADSLAIAMERHSMESYYVEAGSYASRRETDPPDYVRNVGKSGISGSDLNWLTFGLDSRARVEWRNNDIRRPESFNEDFPLLLRQRTYIGVVDALDPFRFAIEFEDARRNNGNYPLDDRDANKVEMIQGYAELYFNNVLGKDPLGNNRPISIRYGRMAFEFLDRRLISLNPWRNTTNSFNGLRLALGQDKNDWQLDALLVRPIDRDIEKFDKADDDRWFSAVIGHWRKWSDIVTIETYYMGLKQNAANENNNREREIHGLGLRLYGWINRSGFNYDLTGMYQIGKDNGQDQRAFYITSEIGYTIKSSKLKPRFSGFFGYVSGDKDPNDNVNNRFERYFGFARPWSSDDYVVMENIITPKVKLEFNTKINKLAFKFDGGYSFYWLASDTDRFNNFLSGNTGNRDLMGNSGKFLGHGMDFRIRFNPIPYLGANMGYAHYTIGEFVENRQLTANGESANSSDFVYLELSLNIFDLLRHSNLSNKTGNNNL